MCWDMLSLRLHFGFENLANSCECLDETLSTAYRANRGFTVFPSARPRLLQLSDFTVWLLAGHYPPASPLTLAVHRRRNGWARTPSSPLTPNITTFPARLTRLAPVDAVHWLAGRGNPASEPAALAAVWPDFLCRMIEFRARVRMQHPLSLAVDVVSYFADTWNLYWDSTLLPIEDFPLAWFFRLYQN